MYFSHAFRKTLLGVDSSSTLSVGNVATTALSAGQLGIYDANFSNIAVTTTTSMTKPFYIVQGSFYTNDAIGTHGGYKESVKSKLINPKYISRMFWIQAKAPQQQVVQIPVTCGLTCDTTYRLRVDVKGSPALRFLSHNLYRVLDSYTGCCSTTNPGYVKDPVATVLNWKEQLNSSPYFSNMVQARAFALKTTNTTTAANGTSISTTSATYVPSSFTGIYVGQRVVGTGIPANSYVTTVNGTTNVTISFPTQLTAPAASVFNAVSLKYYNDLYMAQSMTTPVINYAGTATYIPGTTTATTAIVGNASTVAAATTGAHILVPAADAPSFTSDCFLELTAAYAETKFGNCTFTVTDNYDLEPLKIIASVLDDAGNPCLTYCIGNPTLGEAGIASIAQASQQASGVGETVVRDLILTGRYRQEAFGDGVNIDTFRMREIEANPGVMSMLSLANRNSLFHKLCILHNVPRWNNPTSVFDNDQYLIEIAIPSTLDISKVFNGATYTPGGSHTTVGGGTKLFGDYILGAYLAASPTGFVELI